MALLEAHRNSMPYGAISEKDRASKSIMIFIIYSYISKRNA